MNPQTFRDLLDRDTADTPPSGAMYGVLRAARSRLRRRRLAGGAAVAALVLGVGGTALALPDRATRAHDEVADQLTDAQVLDRCLAGSSDPVEAAMTASGSPTVATSVRTDLKIIAAISSADGAVWGDCWIWLKPQADGERHAGMDLFDATRTSSGPAGGWSYGTGCGVPETEAQGCDLWALSAVDKLPPEVAAVRYDLGDGTSVTVPTVDGFAVLNVLHPLPPGGRIHHDGTAVGFEFGTQLTYLDAQGTAIAAARLGRAGWREPDVPGLPPLRTYRSLGVPFDPDPPGVSPSSSATQP